MAAFSSSEQAPKFTN
ncbi:hypothetical protein ACKLNS_06875 [Enterobacter hormaechei]|nr:hypothetical protein [Enterobacter hormaechei]MCC2932331.1 hypothetical protein [Enterobacter hormaechei]MCC4521958.1 hypothetical protein [Enterobacter hormaechei]MCC4553374.1 hypothetical protein [Enterobacter hormaechei]MCF2294574.1 hypothetical protein [Enterobacter hormaechei]